MISIEGAIILVVLIVVAFLWVWLDLLCSPCLGCPLFEYDIDCRSHCNAHNEYLDKESEQ